MNKYQYIELLKLRDITQLNKGESVNDAVKRSGGEPTFEELAKTNQSVMEIFIDKYHQAEERWSELNSLYNSLLEDYKELESKYDADLYNRQMSGDE